MRDLSNKPVSVGDEVRFSDMDFPVHTLLTMNPADIAFPR
jgi:hypothetical protein